MSKEQVKEYFKSGKVVKDLANKATEAGYDVSEADLEEVLGGIKIIDKESGDAATLRSQTGGDNLIREGKEGALLRETDGSAIIM